MTIKEYPSFAKTVSMHARSISPNIASHITPRESLHPSSAPYTHHPEATKPISSPPHSCPFITEHKPIVLYDIHSLSDLQSRISLEHPIIDGFGNHAKQTNNLSYIRHISDTITQLSVTLHLNTQPRHPPDSGHKPCYSNPAQILNLHLTSQTASVQ